MHNEVVCIHPFSGKFPGWLRGSCNLLSSGVRRPLFLQGVKLTTLFHQVPRLRMSGAIPPLHKYVFVAWCLVKHEDNFTFNLQKVSG
jgi:hypothetical protein